MIRNIAINDFFSDANLHDAILDSVNLDVQRKFLSLDITATNFANIRDRELGCDSIGFRCSFSEVAFYSFNAEKFDEYNDPFNYYRKYAIDRVKIDSFTSDIDRLRNLYKEDELDFHSIELHLFPGASKISFVFSFSEIIPQEPIAFWLLVKSGEVKIPWLS